MTTGKGSINVVRFEVVGLDSATRERWKALAQSVKRVTNCFWRVWLAGHNQAGNPKRVRQYLADLQTWHKDGAQGEPPVCEVQCLTTEMTSAIRAAVRSEYPELNSRCIELTLQVLGRRLFRMKSSKGAIPRWMRILADDGEFPSSASPMPIPFDKGNSEIIVPTADGEAFQLQVRVDRIERPDRSYASSTKDLCRLRSNNQSPILWQIANGELIFSGSNLVYREAKNKWFAHIYYQARERTESPELNARHTAFLRPAQQQPWWLRIDGFHHFVGGRNGKHVAHTRQQLLTDRWGRQESYKHASSARKGHGRDRAVGRIDKLQDRWKDFVRTANQQLAQQVVALCVEHKCGKLVYFQPTGAARETRFLHTAGKSPDRPDNSGWDWGQVGSILQYKCQQAGIKLEIRKVGETKARPSVVEGALSDGDLGDGQSAKEKCTSGRGREGKPRTKIFGT